MYTIHENDVEPVSLPGRLHKMIIRPDNMGSKNMCFGVDETKIAADSLPEKQIRKFEGRYEKILKEGYEANPLPKEPTSTKKKRGKRKKSKARNLLERLDNYREEALGFMYDFSVPFDNNLGERDVRMMKVRQKILALMLAPMACLQ